MTTERQRELGRRANSLAGDGEFSEAGDLYVRAAFEEAGQSFGASSHAIELRMLFKACLCYRLANQHGRCSSISRIGIELAQEYANRFEEEVKPNHPRDQARHGAWYEFIGDFRLIADMNGVDEAYNQAKESYDSVGDPSADFVEGPIKSVQAIFGDIVLHVGEDDRVIDESRQRSLTQWVDYKRNCLPKLIDQILSSKDWNEP